MRSIACALGPALKRVKFDAIRTSQLGRHSEGLVGLRLVC